MERNIFLDRHLIPENLCIKEYYLPEDTHKLFWRADTIPRLQIDEAQRRADSFSKYGFQVIASGLARWDATPKDLAAQAIKFTPFMRTGFLIGPYVESGELLPGIKMYLPSEPTIDEEMEVQKYTRE